MGYLIGAIRNFFRYTSEFGLSASLRVFLNNRRKEAVSSLLVSGYRYPLYYRKDTTDFPILRITIGQKLLFTDLSDPRLIIDAGANVGYVSVFYANKFPAAKIVAVEMEESNFQILQKNCAPYEAIEGIRAALWNHEGGVSFENAGNKDSYSLVGGGSEQRVTVPSITVASLTKKYQGAVIDLLKLDIEGAEVEVLESMKSEGIQPSVLVVELHDRLRPGCSQALESYLQGKKYRRKKIYEYDVIDFR